MLPTLYGGGGGGAPYPLWWGRGVLSALPAMWEDSSEWIVEHSTYIHPKYGEVTISNYSSPVIPLETGGAHFTNNPVYHLPFPKDDNAVLSTFFTIVDGAGSTQTPLSEVYNRADRSSNAGPSLSSAHCARTLTLCSHCRWPSQTTGSSARGSASTRSSRARATSSSARAPR